VIPILVGLWRKILCLRKKFNKNEVGSMASEAKAEEQTSSYLVFCEVETSSTAQQDMIFWIP
jgi:hypothetical protein